MGALLEVGLGVWGFIEQNKAAQEAANASEQQAKRQKEMLEQAQSDAESEQAAIKKEMALQERKASSAKDKLSARSRQKALAMGSEGRQSTILTGPLGVPGESTQAKKTLLGG